VPKVELRLKKSTLASEMQAEAFQVPKPRPEGGGVARAELRCGNGWWQQLCRVASEASVDLGTSYCDSLCYMVGAASTDYAANA
jgi:hypothetical protein